MVVACSMSGRTDGSHRNDNDVNRFPSRDLKPEAPEYKTPSQTVH
jgi:hypothetical protein